MDDVWAFLSDPGNRVTLSWLGGGFVVVAGGVWAVFKFFRKTGAERASSITVTADHGGIAAGRDAHVTPETKRSASDSTK